MSAAPLGPGRARRIALAAQGFGRPRPRRPDVRHLRATVRRLGLLQLDFVNVLIPAHFLVLFSRLGPYSRRRLHQLVYRDGEFIEQWAHEASIVPMDCWPLLAYRRETHRPRPRGFEKFLERHPAYVEEALEQVRRQGPLTADDLPAAPTGIQRIGDRWGWSMGVKRQVLEAHFGRGLLAVSDRLANFARVYDLAQRVIDPAHYRRRADPREARLELLQRAARSHGLGTAADLADYFRMPVGEARPLLEQLAGEGRLHRVRVRGWREPAFLHPRADDPGRVEAAALLSPFDPLLWHRPRVERLFGFDYRLEIFVPARKRRWGYYVLPFLLGERLVARVDLKADRAGSQLRVMAAYLEREVEGGRVAGPLLRELRTLAGWLGLDDVAIEQRGDLAARLTRAP